MEWEKILTSALSTLVGALIVGACAIVWTGATSVDDKINAALAEQDQQFASLLNQRDYMVEAVKILESELIDLNKRVNDLTEANKWLKKEIEGGKDFPIDFPIPSVGSSSPVPLPPKKGDDFPEIKDTEEFRDEYIQQQLPSLLIPTSPPNARR
jgi:hypothetical protein